jgi:hypothetical protein
MPDSFFEEYHKHMPKTEPVSQYELRKDLYELFHYLNHTVLFGVSEFILLVKIGSLTPRRNDMQVVPSGRWRGCYLRVCRCRFEFRSFVVYITFCFSGKGTV